MLRRVALVITDVSEELNVSIIRVTIIGQLGSLAVTSNRRTLQRNTKLLLVHRFCHPDDGGAKFLRNVGSYKNHAANIPEDAILPSHHRENLKSYTALTG
jgi:hypothetical protein